MDPQMVLKQAQDFMAANPDIGLGLLAIIILYILFRIVMALINIVLVTIGIKKETFGLLDSVKHVITDARKKLGV